MDFYFGHDDLFPDMPLISHMSGIGRSISTAQNTPIYQLDKKHHVCTAYNWQLPGRLQISACRRLIYSNNEYFDCPYLGVLNSFLKISFVSLNVKFVEMNMMGKQGDVKEMKF